MDACLVLFVSGNHAILVKEELKKIKVNARIESTPCSIAKEGCSYCIKVPCDCLEKVLKQVELCRVPIRGSYRISIVNGKRKHIRI